MANPLAWIDEMIGLAALIVDGVAMSRRTVTEFVPGAGVSMSASDDDESNRTVITIEASGDGELPISLDAFRDASLAPVDGATTPVLTDASGTHVLSWAATDVDSISAQITLPSNIDGSEDITITLWVASADAGDPATFTIESCWDGDSAVADTATDASPSADTHTITATIAAADIPDEPSRLTITLTPAAHADDAIVLHGIRISYSRA